MSDVVIVLDHEHAVAAAACGGFAAGRGGLDGIGRRRGLRQVDREGRAPAGLARDRDVAVGLLGKAERLAEAEAGALADFLGGEERLEDRLEQGGRDARPVSVTVMATKSPARADWARSGGMAATLRTRR